ncbi:hypothetical protein BU16DRAFT_561408 [Lophium mytilinum]|uniref:F-box domain-containing protein n=1 Tax=Lophium mytilinum TaxID=390894 RepID=A0A6A6QSL6_9PEZI|nr:hypothetical protein BU16DRAFT_561408 [Lophium mytilinum]
MACLLDLPVELIHEIFSYISNQADLSRLSRVSRHLNAVAIPFVYETYPNGDNSAPWRSFRPFLRTIIARPDLAQLVKRIELRRWETELAHIGKRTNEWHPPEGDIDLFVNMAKKISLIAADADAGGCSPETHNIEAMGPNRVPHIGAYDQLAWDLSNIYQDEEGSDQDSDVESERSAMELATRVDDPSDGDDSPLDDEEESRDLRASRYRAARYRAARYLRQKHGHIRLKRDKDWLRMLYSGVEDADVVLLLALLPRLQELHILGMPNTPFLYWDFILKANPLVCLKKVSFNPGPKGGGLDCLGCLFSIPSLRTLSGTFMDASWGWRSDELASSNLTVIDIEDSVFIEWSAEQLIHSCKALETFGYAGGVYAENIPRRSSVGMVDPRSLKHSLRSQRRTLKNLKALFVYSATHEDHGGGYEDHSLGSLRDFDKLETLWVRYEELVYAGWFKNGKPVVLPTCLSDVLPPSIVSLHIDDVSICDIPQLGKIAMLRAARFPNLKTVNMCLAYDHHDLSYSIQSQLESDSDSEGVELNWQEADQLEPPEQRPRIQSQLESDFDAVGVKLYWQNADQFELFEQRALSHWSKIIAL